MARYKDTQKAQDLLLSINLSEQIIPGTFEYTVNHLIDKKLDLSIFDRKYNNDYTGAPAMEPRILLKIIIYCYQMGIISSRKIAMPKPHDSKGIGGRHGLSALRRLRQLRWRRRVGLPLNVV